MAAEAAERTPESNAPKPSQKAVDLDALRAARAAGRTSPEDAAAGSAAQQETIARFVAPFNEAAERAAAAALAPFERAAAKSAAAALAPLEAKLNAQIAASPLMRAVDGAARGAPGAAVQPLRGSRVR